ncbi:MAG: hypothetical protein AAF810_17700, partial [Cyanobacteria bacterium P01_D01_bin.36]
DLNNALEQIKSIPEDQHPGINSYEQHRAIAALKRSAINRFLSAYIGQQYPCLDDNIFKLKRTAKLVFDDFPHIAEIYDTKPEDMPRTENKIQVRWVRIPLLAHIDVDRYSSWTVCRLGICSWPGKRGVEAHIQAKIPVEIPVNIRSKSFDCMAKVYDAIACLYRSSLAASFVSDISVSPSLKAYWIPTKEEMFLGEFVVPPARDPALVLHILGSSFLIGTWDEPEDNRFNALLKEFS